MQAKANYDLTRSPAAFGLLRAALACSLVFVAACASAEREGGFDPIVITNGNEVQGVRLDDVPARLMPLFERLQELVLAREDQAARNVLARIYAQRPTGKTREFADGFDRVLKGRELVSSVRIELVTQAHATDPTRYRVALFLLNESTRELTLHPGPATLTLEQTIVDGNGHERRNQTSSTTDSLPEFVLLPGEPFELSLQEFSAPVGFAARADGSQTSINEGLQAVLATRYSWHIDLLSSMIEVEDEEFPAMNFQIDPADRVWVSGDLPKAEVQPDEFLDRARSRSLDRVELMGLAVRIPVEAREAALQLLEPEIEKLDRDSLRVLAPSLRWISGDSRLGDDPAAWQAWIAARRARAVRAASGGGGLDLPSSASDPNKN